MGSDSVSGGEVVARTLEQLGVAITSTRLGAANSMGGLFEAHFASSSVLAVTGQVETRFLGKGRGYIHEAEQQQPMLAAVTREALTVRPRPVAVGIPIDLQYREESVPPAPWQPPGSVSFVRGLNVLITVAEAGEARADQVAADLGIPLSTVYRYLRTLRELDLVEERDGSYVAGWRLLEMSGQDLAHTRLVEFGHAFLREIAEATGETAVLTVRAGTHAACIRQVESRHAVRIAFRIGQLLPLYAGAGQRLLLAYAPETVVERVLSRPLRRITDRTLGPGAILRELKQVRHNGYLVSHGELTEGAIAVAVPVFAGGEIACSLAAAGPESRCSPAWQKNTRATLVDVSHRLADVLSDRPSRT